MNTPAEDSARVRKWLKKQADELNMTEVEVGIIEAAAIEIMVIARLRLEVGFDGNACIHHHVLFNKLLKQLASVSVRLSEEHAYSAEDHDSQVVVIGDPNLN